MFPHALGAQFWRESSAGHAMLDDWNDGAKRMSDSLFINSVRRVRYTRCEGGADYWIICPLHVCCGCLLALYNFRPKRRQSTLAQNSNGISELLLIDHRFKL